jgi:hypothetical protein
MHVLGREYKRYFLAFLSLSTEFISTLKFYFIFLSSLEPSTGLRAQGGRGFTYALTGVYFSFSLYQLLIWHV